MKASALQPTARWPHLSETDHARFCKGRSHLGRRCSSRTNLTASCRVRPPSSTPPPPPRSRFSSDHRKQGNLPHGGGRRGGRRSRRQRHGLRCAYIRGRSGGERGRGRPGGRVRLGWARRRRRVRAHQRPQLRLRRLPLPLRQGPR